MRTSALTKLGLTIALSGAAAGQEDRFPNNSGRKLRVPPSETAARCGSQIQWRKDLATALADAKAANKLVLWYVPTVAGSPMDRRPELDRYMRAGPFTWRDVVIDVNDAYVPLDAVPRGDVQKELGLVREKFIEPGLLVLDADGKERARIDKLSTLNPLWIDEWLVRHGGKAPRGPTSIEGSLAKAWAAYGEGDWDRAEASVEKALATLSGNGAGMVTMRTEALFLRGAILCRSGRSEQAKEVWAETALKHPDEPWGWKCAMEAEGHGPFVRGFEDFAWLGADALGPAPDGTKAPAGLYTEEQIRQRCTDYLLGMQREHGGYDDSIYDFGGTDSLPNVYVAGTAIVGLALLEAWPKGDDPRVESALDKIVSYALDDRNLASDDADELLWAHVYRARLCARLLDLRAARAEVARGGLAKAAAAVSAMQMRTGAWHHEYPNPFVSASALLALNDAQRHGVELDRERVDKGLLALLSCRAPQSGAFSYGQSAPSARLSVAGAAGRMPLCEHALHVHGRSSAEALQGALEAAFAHHEQLESVRKYDDHANRLGYGGFFFWYDMHARTEAIRALPASELRAQLLAKQRAIVLSVVEIDGCFVDSHELGKSYGTAMGLLCLALCDG